MHLLAIALNPKSSRAPGQLPRLGHGRGAADDVDAGALYSLHLLGFRQTEMGADHLGPCAQKDGKMLAGYLACRTWRLRGGAQALCMGGCKRRRIALLASREILGLDHSG